MQVQCGGEGTKGPSLHVPAVQGKRRAFIGAIDRDPQGFADGWEMLLHLAQDLPELSSRQWVVGLRGDAGAQHAQKICQSFQAGPRPSRAAPVSRDDRKRHGAAGVFSAR